MAIDQKLFRFIEQNDPTVFYTYMKLKEALAILCPMDRDVYRAVKGRYVEGALSAYRLGEKTRADRIGMELLAKDDERIKYWIYEFNMPLKVRREFEAACAIHELTPDEFFQAAILRVIEQTKADPEAERKKILVSEKNTELTQVHLVRYYPVYKGETEAQAYRRKLAEEAESKNGGKDTEAKDISGI